MAYKDKERIKEYKKEYHLKNKERIKEYRLKNKERIKEQKREYRLKNKERLKEYHKEYNLKNKERLKEYRLKNKERIKERMKEYRLKNRKRAQEHENKRKKTDLNFKLRKALRIRIYHALKGIAKSKRTMELVGCTIDELWTHLESQFKEGMTRENHGSWHVDHIKPCASFNLTDPEQQGVCFHYTNLQPLWASDNISKGGRIH
jgi:hypothetical protein